MMQQVEDTELVPGHTYYFWSRELKKRGDNGKRMGTFVRWDDNISDGDKTWYGYAISDNVRIPLFTDITLPSNTSMKSATNVLRRSSLEKRKRLTKSSKIFQKAENLLQHTGPDHVFSGKPEDSPEEKHRHAEFFIPRQHEIMYNSVLRQKNPENTFNPEEYGGTKSKTKNTRTRSRRTRRAHVK